MCSVLQATDRIAARRSRRRLVWAAVFLAPPLAGQETAALQARADSLLREWRQANVFAAVQDSLRAAEGVAGRDTVRVGALTVLVNPSPLPVAQAAARAWPVLERFYGPAARALADRPVRLLAVDPDTGARSSSPGDGYPVPWDETPERLSMALLAMTDLSGLDRGVHDWLGGRLAPGGDLRPLLGQVYVQLITAPWRSVHRCFAGDLAACRDVLSLTDSTGRLTRWYTPDERRRLVAGQAGARIRELREGEFRSCAAGSDSACLDLLESLSASGVSPPLDYGARYTFLVTAIGLDGSGTFSRLLATPGGTMGSRLAEASRLPEDSLVARWRADVLAARPRPVSLPPLGSWIALMWAGVFMGCALGSSRWRVH